MLTPLSGGTAVALGTCLAWLTVLARNAKCEFHQVALRVRNLSADGPGREHFPRKAAWLWACTTRRPYSDAQRSV